MMRQSIPKANKVSLPDYEELQEIVNSLSDGVNVAELDGLVAGMLVRGPSVPVKQLMLTLKEYLDDSEAKQLDTLQQGYLVQLVASLAEHAQELHALDDMEWVPLLPDEDQGLELQVQGLASWCAGFIHGCGVALGGEDGPMRDDDLPGSTHEMLADLAEISRVDAEQLVGNDAENDYTEILEYVRTAAFTCALELSRWNGEAAEGQPMAPAPDLLQ